MKPILAGVTTMHRVHSPEIGLLSDDAPRSRRLLEDRPWWRQDGPEHYDRGYGSSLDTYGKREGRWLFTSRQMTRLRVDMSPDAISPID